MPRVLARTPEWLVPPSPGFDLFAATVPKALDSNANQKDQHENGPLRIIAHGRGTELFVAQGNEVRWADLQALKDGFEETKGTDEQLKRSSTTWRYKDSFDSAYKVSRVYQMS
jgi:nucleoporin NUP82